MDGTADGGMAGGGVVGGSAADGGAAGGGTTAEGAAVGGGENLATQHEKEFVTEWIGPHSLFTPFVRHCVVVDF